MLYLPADKSHSIMTLAEAVFITRAYRFLIDAGMPFIFWFCVLNYSFLLKNHLCNLSTNNALQISSNLVTMLIAIWTYLRKGRIFDLRVRIKWLIGLLGNATKNTLILSPLETPQHCWPWEFFWSPLASFFEYFMYGLTLMELDRLMPHLSYSAVN